MDIDVFIEEEYHARVADMTVAAAWEFCDDNALKRAPPWAGVCVPDTGWSDADPTFRYRVPDCALAPMIADQHLRFEQVALRMLLPLLHECMRYHRMYSTVLSDQFDEDVFQWLAVEILLHSEDALRQIPVVLDALCTQVWARIEATRSFVFGDHPHMGHNRYSTYHEHFVPKDLHYVKPYCDAYNSAVQSLLAPPPRATIDEIVINHPGCTHKSHKSNADGPEFVLLSCPLIGSGTHIHLHLIPRVHAAQQGSSARRGAAAAPPRC